MRGCIWAPAALPRTKFGIRDARAVIKQQIAIRKAVRREVIRVYSLFGSSTLVVLLVRKRRAADPFARANANPEIMDRPSDRRQTLWVVSIAGGAIDDQKGVGFVLSLLLLLRNEPGIAHIAVNIHAIQRQVARRHMENARRIDTHRVDRLTLGPNPPRTPTPQRTPLFPCVGRPQDIHPSPHVAQVKGGQRRESIWKGLSTETLNRFPA